MWCDFHVLLHLFTPLKFKFFSFSSFPLSFALSDKACPVSTSWALCVAHNLQAFGTHSGCGNIVCCANKTDWTWLGPAICRCLFGSPSLLSCVLCVPPHWHIMFEAKGRSMSLSMQRIELAWAEPLGFDPCKTSPRHPDFNLWMLGLHVHMQVETISSCIPTKTWRNTWKQRKNNLSVGGLRHAWRDRPDSAKRSWWRETPGHCWLHKHPAVII